MSHADMGPKQMQLRALRAARFAKPSPDALRAKVADIKPKPKKAKKRGKR